MLYDVISSGSKGNATLVVSGEDAILLDFGISKKKVTLSCREYGLGFESIEGFFVTHSHSDHASHISSAPKDLVYASTLTLPSLEGTIASSRFLLPLTPVDVGPFRITPVPLSHDAKNPMGFLVEDGKESLVYVTDTGFVPESDFDALRDRTYYIFESNHDSELLFHSGRPDSLIRRIISDKGHLSNTDCAYYLSVLMGEKTKEIVLAHLSDECNTPLKAKATFEEVVRTQLGYLPDGILRIASDREETKGGRR